MHTPFFTYLMLTTAVLILLKALLTAVETAIACVNSSRVKERAASGERFYQYTQTILAKPEPFIAAIHTLQTLAALLIGAFGFFPLSGLILFMTAVSGSSGAGDEIGGAVVLLWIIFSSIIVWYCALLFGNLLPSKFALKQPEFILRMLLRPVWLTTCLVRPLVKLLSWTGGLFAKLFKLAPGSDEEDITEEEILMMVNVGEESGTIDEDEKEMINNIFKFDNKTAGEIATHRKNIVALPESATIEQVMDTVIYQKYSRIPVYADNIDNIIGILYIKDFFKYWVTHKDSEFDMKAILMKPLFVPSSKKTDALFDELIAKKIHFSIVVDEYGGTVGIVTLEDLIEEIMGDIFDEYDTEMRPEVAQLDENTFIIDGAAELDVVSEELDVALPVDEYDTLSGFLISQLGHIPSEAEQPEIEFQSFLFKIEKMENKMIALVKVCRVS